MISIVIPTLDEERALPETLKAIAAQTSAAAQVIVVDGGSRDTTCSIARAVGATLVNSARGRANQMNNGAGIAIGDWLLFLHADTILPPGALAAVQELSPSIEAGCFRQAFDTQGFLLALTSRVHNWRCAKTRIMYGDQALFVRRRVFNAVGGFPEGVLEDVRLSECLRLRAPPVLLPLTVITSARRFREQGVLVSLLRIVVILFQHLLRVPVRAGRRFFEPIR